MKLAIVGSRNLDKIEQTSMKSIRQYVQKHIGQITEIVSGGARGADTYAELVAQEFGIPVKVFQADWEQYGRSAGPIRNKQIVDYADKVVAFYYGNERSKGAFNSIQQAIAQNKPVEEHYLGSA